MVLISGQLAESFTKKLGTYRLQCWNQGCYTIIQREKEVRAKGYTGSQRAIYRYT